MQLFPTRKAAEQEEKKNLTAIFNVVFFSDLL